MASWDPLASKTGPKPRRHRCVNQFDDLPIGRYQSEEITFPRSKLDARIAVAILMPNILQNQNPLIAGILQSVVDNTMLAN